MITPLKKGDKVWVVRGGDKNWCVVATCLNLASLFKGRGRGRTGATVGSFYTIRRTAWRKKAPPRKSCAAAP